MQRAAQFVGVVLFFAVAALRADQKALKVPKPAAVKNAVKNVPKPNAGAAGRAEAAAKAEGVPKPGAKMAVPGNPAERLLTMTPEQREIALEKLPPDQQKNVRKRLENFDKLPQAEKDRQIQRNEQLASLPPETYKLVRQRIMALNNLPDDQKPMVRKEYQQLSRMTDEQRRERLASDSFKNRYTTEEQQILADLSEYYPAPGK